MARSIDVRPNIPFGGAKQSGIGVELGEEGLAEFTSFRSSTGILTPGIVRAAVSAAAHGAAPRAGRRLSTAQSTVTVTRFPVMIPLRCTSTAVLSALY